MNEWTRSTQRAQTSAERQHNRIAEWFLQCKLAMQLWSESTRYFSIIQWIRISDFGLLDPVGDPDRHQNLSPRSLGHALPLQEILSKSIHNFSPFPISRILAPWFCSFRLWRYINHLLTYLLTDRQTDRRTDRSRNITSFFGAGNEWMKMCMSERMNEGIIKCMSEWLSEWFCGLHLRAFRQEYVKLGRVGRNL